MTQEGLPFSIGTLVLGGGALLLSAVLVLGFLLPTEWEASASLEVPAAPSDVFAYLDSPEGWRAWTPWPDSVLVRSGPERGEGSTMSWDDEELGSGSWSLGAAETDRRVAYDVEVGGGAMRTSGVVALTPRGEATLVEWSEQGDLGNNPLMGFWAFFMNRAQTREMEKGLAKLGAVASGAEPALTRSDSASTGGR